ncbi:MAG TPA: metallophosphoesterase [Jatrophihabitans sp.]|nr:metallophosphoesterase [Jatrophihabitans sp.]
MARLLHISDTHLVAPGSASEYPDIDPETRLVAVLAAAVDAGPFDAVAVTGDIADDGSHEAVARVRELVAPIAPIVVAVPGNHDRTDAVTDVFGGAAAQVGAWQLVGAATNEPGEVAGEARPVVDLLDSCTGPAAVLMHHPLRSRSTHPWFTLGGADRLERRLLEHRWPLLLLSGHTHEAFEEVVGNARLLGAPSTFYGIAHDREQWEPHGAPTGARVVELSDQGISLTHLVLA